MLKRAMTSTGTKIVKPILAVAFSIVVLAACNPIRQPAPSATTSTSSRPTSADLDQTTIRWIDNPAIDLMSPEGTFLRAAAESFRVIGSSPQLGYAGLDEGYPGFRQAFNGSFPAKHIVGNGDTWVGTRFLEVQDVHRDGDQFTVHYCDYSSLIASKESDGQYSSAGSDPAWGAWTMIFGPDPKITAAQQISPKINQRGPARKPSDNVFGTWVMFKQDIAVEYPQCSKLAPGTPTNWPNPYIRNDPPPTLPPDPGWPEAGAA